MASGVFSGWKDIANYMGKGVRTVQRYERDFGLPVRRPAGKCGGPVLATRTELDAWMNDVFRRAKAAAHDSSPLGCEDLRCVISQLTTLLDQLKKGGMQFKVSRTQLCQTILQICNEAGQSRNGSGYGGHMKTYAMQFGGSRAA